MSVRYVSLLLARPFLLMSVYVLMMALLGAGLWRSTFIRDPEELFIVRNSQATLDSIKLESTFIFNQNERHFINKLLDLGHYVEIIVTAKKEGISTRGSNEDLLKPEYNLINQSILNEYNELFDRIISLAIVDVEKAPLSSANKSTMRNYTYLNDLCARRLGKCSIEGGLLRNPSFQRRLLEHTIDYHERDPKSAYGDRETVDGFSFNVIFGRFRKEKLLENSTRHIYGRRWALTHTGAFRTRFDLLSNSNRNKELSIKWMHRFAAYMNELQETNLFRHLNFSFHTSHTLKPEIEKYAQKDLNKVLLSFALMWLWFIISMWVFQSVSLKGKSRLKILCNLVKLLKSCKCAHFCRSITSGKMCLYGGSFLPLAVFIQMCLSILASMGALSMLGIAINSLMFVFFFTLTGKFIFFYGSLKTTLHSSLKFILAHFFLYFNTYALYSLDMQSILFTIREFKRKLF
jgi:hypothetical protein